MAEEILGISAHFDLNDVESSFEKLCDKLVRAGTITESVSKQIQTSVSGIGSATDESVKKKAIQDLTDLVNHLSSSKTVAEGNIDAIKRAIGKLEESLTQLKRKREESLVNSAEYSDITKQIQTIESQLEAQKNFFRETNEQAQTLASSVDMVTVALENLKQAQPTEPVILPQNMLPVPVDSSYDTTLTGTMLEQYQALKGISTDLANARQEAIDLAVSAFNVADSVQEVQKQVAVIFDGRYDGKIGDIKSKAQELSDSLQDFSKIDYSNATAELNALETKITKFSETTGVSFDEVQVKLSEFRETLDLASKGLVGEDEFSAKLNELGAALNDNFSSSVENIRDKAVQIQDLATKAAEIMQSSVDAQKKLVDDLTKKLDELQKKREELNKVGDIEGVKKLDSQISTIRGHIDESNQRIQILTDNIEHLGEKAAGAADSLQKIDAGLLQSQVEGAGNALEGFNKSIEETEEKEKELKTSNEGVKKAFDLLPGPIKSAVNGFNSVKNSMMAIIKTPLGIALAAIALALSSVFTWFKKTAEGQKTFAKLSAYIGSLIKSITDIVAKFGGVLFHAFADANSPVSELANTLRNTLVTALNTVGFAIRGLWRSISALIQVARHPIEFMENEDFNKSVSDQMYGGIDDIKKALGEGWKTVKNAFQYQYQAYSGAVGALDYFSSEEGGKAIDNIITDLGRAIKQAAVDAEAAYDAAGELNNLEEEKTGHLQNQKDLQDQIVAQKQLIKTLTGEQRELEEEHLAVLTTKYYDTEIERARKLLDITQELNGNHEKTIEIKEKERKLQSTIEDLERKKAAALRAQKYESDKAQKKEEKAEQREEAKKKRKEEQAAKKAEREKKKQEREAQRNAAREKREQEKKQRAAEREAKRIEKMSEKERSARHKQNEIILSNINEEANEEKELKKKIEKQVTKATESAAQRTYIEHIDENEEELNQILDNMAEAISKARKRQMEEFYAAQAVRKAQGKKTREWDEKLDLDNNQIEKIRKQYRGLYEWTEKAQIQADYENAISKHKSFTEQYKEIEEQFTTDLLELRRLRIRAMQDGDEERVEALSYAIAKRTKEHTKQLIEQDIKEIKSSPLAEAIYENLNYATAKGLKTLIAEYKLAADAAQEAKEPTKAYYDELAKLQKILDNDAPFKAITKSVDEIANAQKQLNEAQKSVRIAERELEEAELNLSDNPNDPKAIRRANEARRAYEDAIAGEEAAWQRYFEAVEKSKEATEAALNIINNLAKSLNNLGKEVGGIIGEIFGAVASVSNSLQVGLKGILQSSEAIDKAREAGDKFGEAVAQVGMWTAAITTMFQVIKAVENFLPTTDSLYEKAAKKAAEINKLTRAVYDYRLAVLASQQAERNWFKQDALSSLTDAYIRHGEVVKAYYNELYAAQEKYQDKAAGIKKAIPYLAAVAALVVTVATYGAGAGFGAAILGSTLAASLGSAAAITAGAIIGTATGVATAAAQAGIDAILYKNNEVAAYQNLRIQTKHKTWFRGEKTEDLRDWVKENLNTELFDSEGLLNLEAAEAVLDKYGNKLVGETKETLETLIKYRKEYDEFMEEIEKYVSDLYSPLVDNMTDALFDWLENGTDVLDKFKEKAHETFAAVAEDMVRQMVIDVIFDRYKDMLKDIYAAYAAMPKETREDKTNATQWLAYATANATDKFLNDTESAIPALQEAVKKIDETFKEHGWDISGYDSSEGSGAFKAASSFSQEQGDELNGRLTALQIGQEFANTQRAAIIEAQQSMLNYVVTIKDNMLLTGENFAELKEMQFDSLRRLTEIRDNTNVLPAMANDIRDMRDDIRNKL